MRKVLFPAFVVVFLSLFAGLPGRAQAQLDSETETFVRGFVRFLAYHEAGHMLMGQIAELNSNSEWSNADREDYADKFAMILLQPDRGDPEGVEEILGAAGGWLQVDNAITANDPHAPPQDRALDILCLLYGSDPTGFAHFETLIEAGRDCPGEFRMLSTEIRDVFKNPTGEMGGEINVVYAAPANGMEAALEFLQTNGVMEDLKDAIEADFYLSHRTTIQAMSCEGKAKSDTFYSDRIRGATPEDDHFVITLCYEMIDTRMKYGMRGIE
jgi:hypothetical protein